MLNQSKLKHIVAVIFICFWVGHFFYMVNPTDFPWWHRFDNDIDGSHSATTVGLLNNSEFTFIYHPAATIATIHGAIFRLLSLFDPLHQSLLNLSAISSLEESFEIIETATRTSRYITLGLYCVFVLVLYRVLKHATQNVFFSFFFTFWIATSKLSLKHIVMIRPEILTLMFLLWAIGLFLSRQSFARYIAIGFLLTYSILSKIQVIPLVGLFVVLMGIILLRRQEVRSKGPEGGWILLGVNILAFPWWTFKRPAFLTSEYLESLGPYTDLHLVYGQIPENFYWLPALLFFCLALLLGVGKRVLAQKSFVVFNWLNGMIVGFSVAIYTVLLPVSVSLNQYIENTRHLIYATLTNVSFRGYLSQPEVELEGFSLFSLASLEKIWERLMVGNILNIPLGMIVIIVGSICLIQLVRKGAVSKERFFLVLMCFVAALGMDFLALKRDPFFKTMYFIYTITLYGLGLAIFVSAIFAKRLIGQKILIGIMSVHVLFYCYTLGQRERTHPITWQNPLVEYENMHPRSEPFWNIAYDALRNSESKFQDELVMHRESLPASEQGVYEKRNREAQQYFAQAQGALKSAQGLKDIARGLDLYRHAIKANPKDLRNYMALAKTFISLNSSRDALPILRGALITFPNDPGVHHLLAHAHLNLKDNKLALHHARKSFRVYMQQFNKEKTLTVGRFIGKLEGLNKIERK